MLGSNIAPKRHLPQACELLAKRLRILDASSVWQTPPMGMKGEDFLNAALKVESVYDIEALKYAILRPIERQLGRTRGEDSFVPRPIDIDIVIFEDEVVDEELWRYAHIAVPMAELLPELPHPTKAINLADFAKQLPQAGFIQRDDVVLNFESLMKG